MSIRLALGARPGHLARHVFCDSVVVSIAGGACGALLAFWTARIIPALLFERDARDVAFSPDLPGIVMAAAVCIAVVFACGLIPLVELRHINPGAILQRESSGPSRVMRRFCGGLVVMQMACSCLLLTSTAVLFEDFRGLLRTAEGTRLDQAVIATVQARLGFARSDLGYEYFRSAGEAMQSIPGISQVAWVGTPPGSERARSAIRIEPPRLPFRDVEVDLPPFGPQSLPLVQLPPISGRMFAGRDTTHACKVAVVNEEAAEALFQGDAVGRSLEGPGVDRMEIVGVVGMRRIPNARARRRPIIFYNAEQNGVRLGRAGPAGLRIPIPPEAMNATIGTEVVSSNYFDALGATAIAGHFFPDESASDDCRVGVINQEAANMYFGGDAVGGALIDGAGRRTYIMGVVRSTMLRTSQRPEGPALYLPLEQNFLPRMHMILRTGGASDVLLGSIRRGLENVSGGAPNSVVVTTLEAQLSRTALAPEHIAMVLLGISATLAVVLSVLGLYGAMGDAVRRRRREMALRFALGAPGWRVLWQLCAEGIQLAGAGIIAGLIGSVAIGHWQTRLRLDSGRVEPAAWVTTFVVLCVAIAIASACSVRRVLAGDPITSMGEL
jgi:hypothetical protein